MVHYSCLVLMFLLFATSSYASKVVPVDVICKQTINPSFCLNILNAKPDADLVTLAEYTIDLGRYDITKTISLIKSLILQSGSDANAKDHYQKCLSHFGEENGALGDLEYTQERLKSGDYMGVSSAASAVLAAVDDCVSGQDPTNPPFQDKSMLPLYVKGIESIVDITLVISKLLLQK